MPFELTPEKALVWDWTWFKACTLVYLAAGLGGLVLSARATGKLQIAAALAVLLILLCGLAYYYPYTNDDSYIFFRYAENIVAGHGPVYNPGERCEGFTSPAWLALLTGARFVGWNVLLAAKAAGIILGVLTLLFVWRSCRALCSDQVSLYLASFLLASSAFFQSWLCSGMDVALFLCWEAMVVFLFVRDGTPELYLWIATTIAGWIRPEANMVIVVAWGWRLWSARRIHTMKTTVLRAMGAALLLALPFVIRYFVYGTLLPTTFFAKSDRTLRSGVGFLFGASQNLGPLVWILALAGLWRLRRTHGWLIIVCGFYAIYFLLAGGDVLTQRFSLYWIPFLWVGIVTGLCETGQWLGRRRLALAIALLLLICAQELHRMYQVTRVGRGFEGYLYVSSSSIGTTETDEELGRFLARHGTPDQRLVTDNIGAIGYYSGLRVIDYNGLTDTAIAGYISRGRRDLALEYIHTLAPEWIACYPGPPGHPTDFGLNTGPLGQWASASYEPVLSLQSQTGYARVLLKRRDIQSVQTQN